MVSMVHDCLVFELFFSMGVLDEPETRDNGASQENQQCLKPLLVAPVKLMHYNLAGGHIDERASRNAETNRVDQLVA